VLQESRLTDTVTSPWPQTAGRFRTGLILTALLALAVPTMAVAAASP